MKYVCDAPGKATWFRVETVGEAEQESALMNHAVTKHFRREREAAIAGYRPASSVFIEQNIGLERHVQATMPVFLTLRDQDGAALVTAMLPPGGRDDPAFRIIIVGQNNADPYPGHKAAIDALAAHFRLTLDRERCFPYRR
jgi:hypothetical protein